jgi:hypothetical protein
MNGKSLGHYLRDTREALGLSLDDAVADLHIRRNILEAFEEGVFDLPDYSEVQIRGFIRNYSRYLYLNEENIIGHYEASLTENDKGARGRRQKRTSRQTTRADVTVETSRVTIMNNDRPARRKSKSMGVPSRYQPSNGMVIMIAGMMIGSATLTGTFFIILYLLYQIFPIAGGDGGQRPDQQIVSPYITATPYSSVLVLTPAPSQLNQTSPSVGVSVSLDGVHNGWIRVTIDGRALAARPIATGERVDYVANNEIVVDTVDAGTFQVSYNGQPMGEMGVEGESLRVVFSREGFAVDQNAVVELMDVPPEVGIIAPIVTPPPGFDYISRFDAPYSSVIQNAKENRPLSVFFYDVTNSVLLANVDMEKQMPVVSAVKGPILMYFFDVVDPEVWGSVPVELWNLRDESDIPPYYKDLWLEHRTILRDLYRMIVVSDNIATGNALAYAYNYYHPDGIDNPIEAFNDWSMKTVGMSAESGMRQWDEGATNHPDWIVTRFNDRMTPIYNRQRFYNNTYSALDLGRFYQWLYTQADRRIYNRAVEVMSIIQGYPGVLEESAQRVGGIPVSKDGYVGPGDRNNALNEHLTADAGLILVGNDAYIVVTMAVNGGDKMGNVYSEIRRIINQNRNTLFWPSGMSFVNWVRASDGPYGGMPLSVEGANFILDYMTSIGQKPEINRNLDHLQLYFQEAYNVWFGIFPNDTVPNQRTEHQSRIISARYGSSGESLHDIAVELGLARR